MNIQTIKISELRPAEWRATYMLKPDLKILTDSINDYGLLSPVIVQSGTGVIIDGFHRVLAVSKSQKLMKSYSAGIPCSVVDVGEVDAMIMHVRLNRGRGDVVAKYMSNIVKSVHRSRVYTIDEIDELLNMNVMESELMLDGSLIKMRKISEHAYSPAWVPIEAPSAQVGDVKIERPPNPDR